MPRIPSAADVNPVGAAASRLPSVRADAADFGLAIAQGLASFGKGVGDVGNRLVYEAQLKEAEDKTEAAKQEADKAAHQVAVREAAIQMVDTWEYDGSAPREAAAKAAKALEAVEDKRLKGLPPERRAALKAASAPIRQGQALRIAQRTQNLSVAALDRQTAETLQLLQKQAVREPQAAAHYAVEGRASLRSLLDAGALTPEQYAAQEAVFRRSLYTAAVRGQPAVAAMAALEDGIYDDALSDPELKRFLMQETGWRLQSETAQGAAGAEAQLARARRGEPVPAALSAGTQRILAAGDMADAALRIERANRVRSEMQSLRYAPEAEVAERVDALTPAADAAVAEMRREIQQEVWIQSQALLRARRTDPAAFAMEQPAVAEAFATAEKNPALLPDAVSARLAAQEVMGLVPEEQNALTKEECSQIVAGLRQLEPQQRIAALMELGKAYGDQSSAVAADLAEAGLSFGEMLAADSATDPEVSGRFAQVVENQGAAKPPEAGAIGEAAEKLIVEGRDIPKRAKEDEAEGSSANATPPLPQRKPGPTLSQDSPLPSDPTAGNGAAAAIPSPRAINETTVIEKYQGLLVGKPARELEKRAKSPAFRDFVLEVEKQADEANASAEMKNLFVRLTLHKMLKEKRGADEARKLASEELGLDNLHQRRSGSTKRESEDLFANGAPATNQLSHSEPDEVTDSGIDSKPAAKEDLDRLLLVLGINPILSEGNPATVLPLVKEVMRVRAYAAAGDYERIKDLRKEINELDGTEHRFLYQPLTAKLDRALNRPETVPWALSDGEVYSVFKALGGSASALAIGTGAMAILEKFVPPARFLKWALSLAGIQQSQMRSLYEAELYRRGIFRRPALQR